MKTSMKIWALFGLLTRVFFAVVPCAGLAGCGDYDGTVVVVSVSGITTELTTLQLRVNLDGHPLVLGSPERSPDQDRFGLELPADITGEIMVEIAGLRADRCVIARGSGSTVAQGERHLDLAIALSAQPSLTCELQISLGGPGKGTVTVDPAALTCSDRCVASLHSDQPVTLSAHADDSSYFAGWSGGGCAGLGACNIQADSSQKVLARFAPKVCNGAGWCWENPLPQGNTLYGIHGVAADAIWAVGDSGTILHFDGSVWSRQESSTELTLRAVWAIARDDVWAVGDGGTMLHFDGTSWSRAPLTPAVTGTIRSLWGRNADTMWAVGDGGTICQLQLSAGRTWQCNQSGLSMVASLTSVWGDASNQLWIADVYTRIARGDGSVWNLEFGNQPFGQTHAMAASADGTLRAIGDKGAVLVRDPLNQTWQKETIPSTADLNALWTNGSSELFVVGGGGAILNRAAGTWSQMTSPTDQALYGVWGSAREDVWAVGAGGVMLHFDGATWSLLFPSSRSDLNGVGGSSSSSVWAVGVNGTVLRRDAQAQSWPPFQIPTTQALYGIWEAAPGQCWVVGANKTVRRFNGSSWEVIGVDLPTVSGSADFYAVTGNHDSFWVVGSAGAVLRRGLDATQWEDWSASTVSDPLRGITAAADTVRVAGPRGLLLHRTASAWDKDSTSSLSPTPYFYDLFSAGPTSPTWVVGSGGVIWSIPTMAPLLSPTTQDLYGIAGDQDDVWIVGAHGTLLHRSGAMADFAAMPSGSQSDLNRVWVSTTGDAWAVGKGGTILRHRKN